MRRAAVLCVYTALLSVASGCAPGAEPSLAPAETTATTAASPASTAPVPSTTTTSPRLAAPNGRTAPPPPASAMQTAAYLMKADQGLRTIPPTASQLPELGHLQQVAYRTLAAQPAWDAEVAARVPAALAATVAANLAARRAFFEIKSGYADTVPAWEIVAPEPLERLVGYYQEAERATGIGWHYLAAINFIETAFGRIRGLSTAGAQGPMQFLPSTWNESGIGRGDINDPHDAIQAAARYLVRRGGPADMRKALFGYNNSNAYVDGVTRYAELMKADPANLLGFYHWEVHFSTARGDLWFPAGVYRQPTRITIDEYLAKAPWSAV